MFYYHVYEYSDINKGWGFNGVSYCIIKAKSKEWAIEWLNKPHDPFWIEHGIEKVTKEEAHRILRPKVPQLFIAE